jgi:quercetin dioxygenase-like cupin family protein
MPFTAIDWTAIAATEHPGVSGVATWRTRQFGELRVRLVEYSPGYVADHWCRKGHILLVLEGELITELETGERQVLKPLQGYHVADDEVAHRSTTTMGARLFIVD